MLCKICLEREGGLTHNSFGRRRGVRVEGGSWGGFRREPTKPPMKNAADLRRVGDCHGILEKQSGTKNFWGTCVKVLEEKKKKLQTPFAGKTQGKNKAALERGTTSRNNNLLEKNI